jgi:predicted TIM-barrel fold metal-dependent hydrolase
MTIDDFFKIDPEPHLIGDISKLNHFPGVRMWWKAVDSIKRPLISGAPEKLLANYPKVDPWEMNKSSDPKTLLRAMDKYNVDIACLLPESMMDTTGYTSKWVSNSEMGKVVEENPERFFYQPNLSPILHKGVNNTIWELEYWVEKKGAKIFKFYPPEDTYINNKKLWPFYERAQELDIVLDIHTGFCWVPPGKSKYALPIYLDDVARDFPDLKIIAFHMGYPYCDDLNMVAMGHPNIYLCLSLLIPWAITAPYKFAKILGEAIRFVGSDRVIWGTDYAGYATQVAAAVIGFKDFQMPEELQEKYGYRKLSSIDKKKIFGKNLAKLLDVDYRKRRIKN